MLDKLHYFGHRKRLRDRFLKSGFVGMADHEVIELLLKLASPRKDVKKSAKDLLSRFGSLRGILEAPSHELRAVKGTGYVAYVAFCIISNKVNGFPNQPATPDLWLVDNKGQHHFIEVKTWRWDFDKNKWKKDTPIKEQLAALALIQFFLHCNVYIILLYPHNNKPFVSWESHIDQFNDFRHKLSQTFIGE